RQRPGRHRLNGRGHRWPRSSFAPCCPRMAVLPAREMARSPVVHVASPEREETPAGRPEWGDTLPAPMLKTPWLRWLASLSGERRCVLALCVLSAFLFVPWLGATGFWDPWEPHYGEVARAMISRGDYVHPWWESAYFFSKPALDLWLMAAAMLAVNTNGPNRWVGVFTEWGVRLPHAATSAPAANLLSGAEPTII